MVNLDITELVQSMANRTRIWRERAIKTLKELGCDDFGYRPASGMSSIGWLLAHQAAVYDYSLNSLILGEFPKRPELFRKHVPGTDGEWTGVSETEIEEYYTSGEEDLLAYVTAATDEQLLLIPEHDMPGPFKGMRVVDLIANTFAHLGHHNGHLNAIVNEWKKKSKK
ncbi:MAG: DinB family protein [Candidatus Thorarchaeota archaeon]